MTTADLEVLQEHIAGHLQSLSLTSLPHRPADGGPTAESSESSIHIAQTQPQPPPPMAPFGHLSNYDLRYHQHQISKVFEPTMLSVPTPFPAGPPLIRNGDPWRGTSGQSWRPHEGQNANKETFDVLVVEDNMVNQRIMFKLLQKNHHTVVIMNNGQEGVDAVKQRKYDIILMDICMPVMVSQMQLPRRIQH